MRRLGQGMIIGMIAFAATVSGQAKALTWNYTINLQDPQFGNGPIQGTFETAGSGPAVQGQTYTITAINPTTFLCGGNTCSVTGQAYSGDSNYQKFQWSGSSFLVDLNGIAFQASEPQPGGQPDSPFVFTLFSSSAIGTYTAADSFSTNGGPSLFYGGSNTLQPAAGPVSSVPGPVPVLGGAAAFGWSRRLRRRISAASSASLS